MLAVFASLVLPALGRGPPAGVQPRGPPAAVRQRGPRGRRALPRGVSGEMAALARTASAGESLEPLLEALPPGPPRAALIHGALRAFGGHEWRDAVRLMRAMPECDAGPPCTFAFNLAMQMCVRDGALDEALQLMGEMAMQPKNGARPNEFTYGIAINGCAKAGQWERGIHLLEEMRACGISPTAPCYSAAISGCANRGVWRAALDLLREMRGVGVEPSLVCYNAAIAACAKGRQPEYALALLDEISPGVIAALQAAQPKNSAVRRAVEAESSTAAASEAAGGAVPRSFEPGTAVVAQATAGGGRSEKVEGHGRRDAAERGGAGGGVGAAEAAGVRLFEAALATAGSVNWTASRRVNGTASHIVNGTNGTASHIVNGTSTEGEKWPENAGSGDQGNPVFESRSARRGKGGHGRGVVRGAWGAAASSPAAPSAAGPIPSGGPFPSGGLFRSGRPAADAFSFASAISACASLEETAVLALPLLDLMPSHNVSPNGHAYAAAIGACRPLKDPELAITLLDQMRGAGLKPSIVEYTSAMSACAEGEEWEPAVRLLARMRGEGVSPDEVAFAAAIQACGRARAWAPAVAVHAQMLAEVRRQGEVGEWGGDGRQGVVGVQGRGTGQIGALRQGGRAGGRAGSLRVTVRSFSAVLSALYRGAGPLSETLRIHDQMRAHSITPDLQCYTVLVSACVEAGDWRRALLFWDELLSRRLRPDAVSAAAALDACLRGRQPAKGLGIVQLIWERFEARRPGRMYTRAEAAALREAHRLAREQAEARGESPPPPSPPPPPPPPPVVVPARMLKGEVPTHLGSELLTARQRTEAISDCCMLLELIRAQGTPRGFLSYDAVMSAIETWGLGWRVRSLLRMQHEQAERSRYGRGVPASADTGADGGAPIEEGVNATAFVEGDTSWFEIPPAGADGVGVSEG